MNLNLDFLSLPLLGASALIFISVLVGVFSKRVGFSFLLAFLVTGMLAGVDGPGGWASALGGCLPWCYRASIAWKSRGL